MIRSMIRSAPAPNRSADGPVGFPCHLPAHATSMNRPVGFFGRKSRPVLQCGCQIGPVVPLHFFVAESHLVCINSWELAP